MKTKRILSFLLAIVLCITLVPVPCKAAKGGPLVALTFDDGPHRTYTKQLLDGLRQRGVNVTFFMVGSNASSNISLVQTAYDDGHEIGNHSYSHPNLNSLNASGVRSQLGSTASVLDQACGAGTDYIVRPPYGNANSTVLSAMGAPAIIWSVDTNDWKTRNADQVYSHIVNHASDGAIILCHDIYSTTVAGALRAVDTLLARGYEFVTVSELHRRRGGTLQDGVKYYNLRNNGIDYGPVTEPVIHYEAVTGGIQVTIDSPSGAPVYYSLDGSRFNQQSTRYTGSFMLTTRAEIRAIAAFDLNGDKSDIVSRKVFIVQSAEPTIGVEEGVLTLDCKTKGAPLSYKLDGAAVTDTFQHYGGPVEIAPGTTIRAYAGGGERHTLSDQVMLHYSANGNLFKDVYPGDWYYTYIDKLAEMGILQGVGDGTYLPDTPTTRAMLVMMLYRYYGEALEEGDERTNTFTDVADNSWYGDAIEWAYRSGIVNGYSDNTFRPDSPVSREEMAKIIAYFMEYSGYELETEVDHRENFHDGSHIQDWAVDCVNALVSKGLMMGDANGNFQPAKSAARAEVAAVLSRLIDLKE